MALMAEREKAIGNTTPNPAAAVEKTSLIALPISSGDAIATTPSVDTPTEVPVAPSRKEDKGKGKKTASSWPRGKRPYEGGEVESQRKKAAQSPRLPTVAESDEATALVIHTPEASKVAEGSHGSDYPWTREGFTLPRSGRDLFKLSQEIQKATPPLTNLKLSDSKIGKSFGGAVLSRAMDSDTYAYARSQSMGAEDTVGQIGAHLSQVIIFLCPFLFSFPQIEVI